MRRPSLCLLALLTACQRAPRQHRPTTNLRARVDTRLIEQYLRTQRFSQGRPTRMHPTRDGRAVLFLRSPADSAARALWVWERDTRQARVLITAERLLDGADESIDAAERARRERQRLSARGITSFALSPDEARVLIPLSGRLFVVERETAAVRELPAAGGAPVDPRWSPDGRAVSLVRGGELAVIDLETGQERRLTEGTSAQRTHAVAEFIAQEELSRMEGYWWSPDGAEIAWQETDLTEVERLRIADPLHPERAPEEAPYPRAGTPNASLRLFVTALHGGARREVTWDHARYPYLALARWRGNAPLTLVVLDRAQRDLAVLAANPDGSTRELVHAHDDAWLNVDPEGLAWSADGQHLLWTTERNGAWQVERYGLRGEAPQALTPPTLDLRGMVRWDEARHRLYVHVGDAAGATQCAYVDTDDPAAAPTMLTADDADHTCAVSADGALQVRETASLAALPTVTVHDGDGAALGVIEATTEQPLARPDVTLTTVGASRMRAAVIRPRGYDPARRYPVLDWVYGGPHSRLVTHAMGRYVTQQWLADQGFIVVMADGRGTPTRGRDWERALAGRLGDVPLEDQVAAVQALGASDPSMDLTRVGVIGWSFGGYLAARAVLERPDVFHAAVAGAPVTEWREYDTCYTERYLGLLPESAAAYDGASLLPRAPTLSRPLLVVHGTADDNVYFHNSLRLVDALFQSGRRFEFLPLPGQTHMVTDPARALAWLLRARAFFAEHLRPAREP